MSAKHRVCVRCRAEVESLTDDFEVYRWRCPNGCHEGTVEFQQSGGEGSTWWARDPADTRPEDEVRAIHEARWARTEAARVALATGDRDTLARLFAEDVEDARRERAARGEAP